MNQHMKWVWAAALLLSPLAGIPATNASPVAAPPAVAPGAPAMDDDAMWLADLFEPHGEPLAFAELAADAPEGGPGLEVDDAGAPGHARHMLVAGPRGRGMPGRHGLARRFAALDLTDAQRDKLRDIHEAAARRNVQRRADMQLARMDLRKLMRSEAPSASAVNTQIDKVSKLQAEGMKARFDTFMQARAVLTPEQQKQLRSGSGRMRMEHDPHD